MHLAIMIFEYVMKTATSQQKFNLENISDMP